MRVQIGADAEAVGRVQLDADQLQHEGSERGIGRDGGAELLRQPRQFR